MTKSGLCATVAFLFAAGLALAADEGAKDPNAATIAPAAEDDAGKPAKHPRPKILVLEKVEGTTLTAKDREGVVQTFELSQDVSVKDAVSCGASDLKAGDPVGVWGALNADGTFTAKRVVTGMEKRPGKRPEKDKDKSLSGTLESTDPLKVKDDEGQIVSVTLDADAKIERLQSIALTDLKPGDHIMVRGKEDAAGVSQAKEISRVPADVIQKMKERKAHKAKKAEI